jgi:ABC-type Fe3+ transport system substrate-binding protein
MARPIRSTTSNAVLAAGALFLAATPLAAQGLNATETRLLPAAKSEGQVTILNPLFADETAKVLSDAFRKRYGLPESFKVNFIRKGTGQVVAQARQEIMAGKITSDVVIVSMPTFYDEAAKRGSFLPLDSVNWKSHEAGLKKGGQYSSYPHVVTPFAYAFQPVWNASCPGMAKVEINSYADVVRPELKGKTISSDLSKSVTYTQTAAALAETGAVDIAKLWTSLKAMEPTVEFRTEAKMQSVISCERPLDMWNLAGRVAQNVDKKPELAKVLKVGYFKEGHVMLGNQAAVMKGASSPNAGQLMIEFMLSKEAADILAIGEGVYTFLEGYKVPAAAASFMRNIDDMKVLGLKDWIGAPTQQMLNKVRDDWGKVFQ